MKNASIGFLTESLNPYFIYRHASIAAVKTPNGALLI